MAYRHDEGIELPLALTCSVCGAQVTADPEAHACVTVERVDRLDCQELLDRVVPRGE